MVHAWRRSLIPFLIMQFKVPWRRTYIELTLMLVAALAALFFYKSAEEKERERDRLEKARVV